MVNANGTRRYGGVGRGWRTIGGSRTGYEKTRLSKGLGKSTSRCPTNKVTFRRRHLHGIFDFAFFDGDSFSSSFRYRITTFHATMLLPAMSVDNHIFIKSKAISVRSGIAAQRIIFFFFWKEKMNAYEIKKTSNSNESIFFGGRTPHYQCWLGGSYKRNPFIAASYKDSAKYRNGFHQFHQFHQFLVTRSASNFSS